MRKTFPILRPALICIMIFTVICGFLYTGLITGIAQIAFPYKANGSIINNVGSALVGQEFTEPKYLIGRPFAAPSNLSPVSAEEQKAIKTRIDWWRTFDPGNTADIPSDLLTGSGSGIDPDISPAAAEFQVPRIAKVRGISEDTVRSIISKYTTGRFLGFIGEPAVNVLKVNLSLDGKIN